MTAGGEVDWGKTLKNLWTASFLGPDQRPIFVYKDFVLQIELGSSCSMVYEIVFEPQNLSDSPLFGGSPQRNMANVKDKNIPAEWVVEEGKHKNIKWIADLGSKAFGGPVIANGKVYMGTNKARDPKIKGAKAALYCFNEADGKFLWEAVHEIPPSDIFDEARSYGLLSAPAVDGNRLYYLTQDCRVICSNAGDGTTVWSTDLMKDYKVVPFHCGGSSPMVVGNLVYVASGNGIDKMSGKVASPKAPSFVALDKNSGKVVWQSNLPGDKIVEGEWSNPAYAEINGKGQVIFASGDSWIYSFELLTGELIWKCNCNPVPRKDDEMVNYFVSTPVVYDSKLYVGMGLRPEHENPTRVSHFLCLDITKKGDVSFKSYDAKAPVNKDSALIWSYGGPIQPVPKKGRRTYLERTCSTAAIHDGLVYLSEERGYIHCLDAKTGQHYWVHDVKTGIWGSPYYVDGKVYLAVDNGSVHIFEANKNKKVLGTMDMLEPLHGTPVVANGVLYINTGAKLYAIAEKK
ncbi:MAG: PQQ-binding-like beta-propeller repeat protein [Gemmataceae bacterium]|nr:PQQ-binding-like beta-propeller repeat protein [Gemmataceae bacterium]MCI0737531.1 PQQ-binding-like beta-propeller repeat protein [Gemmataceae bacterium]